MVRHALIAASLAVLAWAAPVRALDVRLPACAPSDVDTALLAELLVIELGDRALEVSLGPALCEVGRTALDVDVVDPSTGARGHDVIVLQVEAETDPRANARTIALAIAERAPRMLALASVPAPETPRALEREQTRAPRRLEPAAALASPSAPTRAEEGSVDTAEPAPLPLPPTIGIAAVGRLAPVLPSWLLGLRAGIGASFDATWALRADLAPSWARASVPEGDVDAVVTAAGLSLVATFLRTPELVLSALARVEAGALLAMGWVSAASIGAPTIHPWITAGLGAELGYAVSESVTLTAEIDASALLWGTRISTWPSGTQIDASYALLDLALGVRIAP
ncbi:MAG: hypothetical protein U0234_26670 [Sandaracinus sp.]